jgi:alpha-beta hydrolase superfamily lysophospholipase
LAERDPARFDEPGQPILETFTASDGYCSYYRRFLPTGPPKARLVCIHGIQSHGGWYTRSCAKLGEAGYEVYFLDRRGAGLNTAHRGDSPGFRRLLDDIAEFIRALPSDGLKRFLIAISWGGKLGVGLQYRHPDLVDGLALLCPGFFPQISAPFWQRLAIGRARVRCPSKFFPIPLNDPKLFTASPKWQEYIAADRFALREGTARLLFSSLALDIYLKRAWKRVRAPVLLMLAEADRIIHNAKTRAYVEKFPSTDKTVIEYPGAHHTLEFEPEWHPYFGDLVQWLDSRSSRRAGTVSW